MPLTGLQPNTQYTVTLTATNACGANWSRWSSPRSVPPTVVASSIGGLQISAIRDRSARVTYNVKSDGATTIEVLVVKAHIDVVRQVGVLARREGLALEAHRRPATRWTSRSPTSAARFREPARSPLAGVTVSVRGPGRVTSAPHGLSCSGKTCAGMFGAGTRVRLSAHPSAGSRFARWSGACTGKSPVCTVRAGDTQVTAYFEKR